MPGKVRYRATRCRYVSSQVTGGEGRTVTVILYIFLSIFYLACFNLKSLVKIYLKLLFNYT